MLLSRQHSPTLAFLRRNDVWLIILALLPVWMLLAVVITAFALGVRVQGLGWQSGLELAHWQRLQNGCVQARGERLRITGWRPVTIAVASVSLANCQAGGETRPPPWTPPFDLIINALSIPGLPPIAVTVRQRDQRWQAWGKYKHSNATATYDSISGRWSAQGQIQAADITPRLLGALTFTGDGLWQASGLDGNLQAQGQQLGHRGQFQRSDMRLEASFAAKKWQLNAELGAPLTLGGDWSLEARQVLRASGNLEGVESLSLNLRAAGPPGTIVLTLDTEGTGVARGQGMLTLAGPSLAGRVPIRWNRQGLELLPASIQLPEGLLLRWPRALTLPLALAGESTISAELHYRDIEVKTVDSLLAWQQATWGWHGRLDLAGKAAGYDLRGFWQGRIEASGLTGEPASLTVRGPDLLLAVRVPVADFQAPGWTTRAEFSGHYGKSPLTGALSANFMRGRWEGTVEGNLRLPFYARGGGLKLVAPWFGKDGQWYLGTGSRATIAGGLVGTTLIKPIAAVATTPLRVGPQGLFGNMEIKAEGVVATRWVLPAVTGTMAAAGRQGRATLRVPAWKSELTLTAEPAGREMNTGAKGMVEIRTPLSGSMSRSLGFTLKQGMLNGQGHWQWQDGWRLKGDISVSGLALDWGGILATGGNGAAHIELQQNGVTLTSIGPVMLAQLDVGTLVRNIRMTVQSDLVTWHVADISADVLGGNLYAATLQWPSSQFQSVTIGRINLAEVAALQNDPNPTVQLAGRVGGNLPLQLTRDSLALQAGRVSNEGPLSLKVLPSAGVTAMSQSNRAVELALDALSNLAIDEFEARLNMKPDGWLDAAVSLKGQNPQKTSLPIVLNYTHRENVFELLRSLRIADDISRRVLNRMPAEGSRSDDVEDTP
ncbi:intermembrane phospholipid transport protein YdbH family protein [Cupriavidus sp. RAF12]|uniref:YdbH domain-containing protein n=1 Tax=Cupriavidus sp. RAF12 TaxID=3233050 RepID=UPI003F8E6729